MNDRMGDEMARGGSALMGFVAGAMVGAGIALLFAPASGAETRKKLGQAAGRVREGVGEQLGSMKEQLGHVRERASEQIGSAKERLGELKQDVNTAIDSGREAFRNERDSRTESTTSKRTS